MLNQWPKESLLKLKEIIREQQAKQNREDMERRENDERRMQQSIDKNTQNG